MSKENRQRILVCDDDPVTARLLQSILLPYGHVDLAENGQEGWKLFSQANAEGHPFDLCCLDIQMPVLDGYGLLERIRNEESEREIPTGERVRVLMITSVQDTNGFLAAAHLGVDGYLIKPVNAEALRESLWDLAFKPDPGFTVKPDESDHRQ